MHTCLFAVWGPCTPAVYTQSPGDPEPLGWELPHHTEARKTSMEQPLLTSVAAGSLGGEGPASRPPLRPVTPSGLHRALRPRSTAAAPGGLPKAPPCWGDRAGWTRPVSWLSLPPSQGPPEPAPLRPHLGGLTIRRLIFCDFPIPQLDVSWRTRGKTTHRP